MLIEQEILDNGGRIGATEACYIHRACTHQMAIELWVRRQRAELDTLTIDQLLAITQVVSREVDRRDSAIEKLRLNRKRPRDVFDALYATPTDSPGPEDQTC